MSNDGRKLLYEAAHLIVVSPSFLCFCFLLFHFALSICGGVADVCEHNMDNIQSEKTKNGREQEETI